MEIILGKQRNFGEKQGIGYDPSNLKITKTTFVRASHQKHYNNYVPQKKHVENKKINFHMRHGSPRRNYGKRTLVCNYCSMHGHTINKCRIRNNPQKFKQVWVPKDALYANLDGPKKA